MKQSKNDFGSSGQEQFSNLEEFLSPLYEDVCCILFLFSFVGKTP